MKFGIVGAGMTGLTVARRLIEAGHDVTVFDRAAPGGLAGGIPTGSPGARRIFLDKFYHHIFKTDRAMIDLIGEHDLSDDLTWQPSRTGLYADGRCWPFGSPRDLLTCTPVGSLWQRLLMGVNLFYFRLAGDWQSMDRLPCRRFFQARGNLAGYRNLWEPLLRHKFGSSYDNIPAAFLWGRIHPRTRSRDKHQESLGYLRGGFQRVADALVGAIREAGGQVHAPERVRQVIPGARPALVTRTGFHRFDRVVWTAGQDLLADSVVGLSDGVRAKLEAVRYMAVTCLVLQMNRRQSDTYWLNSIDPTISFGAVIEHTNLVDPSDYGGRHVLYVVNYHEPDDPRFARGAMAARGHAGAKDILHMHVPSLKRVYPGFRLQDVVKWSVFRASQATPVYDVGFRRRRPPYGGWLAGVDVVGMGQVYPQDRNMNACVENGARYADIITGRGVSRAG